MNPTIELSGVSKSFGPVEAVKDVSFSLKEGEIVALVGHNGAGKTTLIKMMLGLIRPTAGTVKVLGEDPATGAAEVRTRLGYLPENVSFNPALTGTETLRFYAALKRAGRGQIGELLERVGLAAAAGRRVRTYSKGMRQRLGLAQALLGRPKLLLLDEPTTGLDPASRRDFYRFLDELRDTGSTILLSSHALSELEAAPTASSSSAAASRSPTARSTSCAVSPACRRASACGSPRARTDGSMAASTAAMTGARSTATCWRSTQRRRTRSRCCATPCAQASPTST